MTQATLFLVGGKIASGKSTLAADLKESHNAVLLDLDHLLSTLWPNEIHTLEDYKRCWPRVCAAIGPIVVSTLKAGTSVVLDFPGNTRGQRSWMLRLAQEAQVPHELHFLDTPDKLCLERLAERNASGAHAYAPTAEQFRQFSALVSLPAAEEGLTVILHAPNDQSAP